MMSSNDKNRKKSNGGEKKQQQQQQQQQEPEPKRLKTNDSSMAIITESSGGGDDDGVNNKRQTQLGNFFTTKKKKKTETTNNDADSSNNETKKDTEAAAAAAAGAAATTTETTTKGGDNNDEKKKKMNALPAAEPLVPTLIDSSKLTYRPIWESHYDSHVIIRKIANKNKNKKKRKMKSDNNESSDYESTTIKVAAFDIDGTLVNWTTPPGQWPSQLNHYELWSSNVITKIRELSDLNYEILLVSNQGGIQKAHTGKKATKMKQIVDWIGHIVDRPIEAVMSTRTIKKCPTTSYHKPTSKLWDVAEKLLFKTATTTNNGGSGSGSGSGSSNNTKKNNFFAAASTTKKSNNPPTKIDLSSSFFVGDSADPDDEQGGVDMKFAFNCGIKFFTPEQYFGISDQERRQQLGGSGGSSGIVKPPPLLALQARSALFGGYLQGPIMLILCGVQGSGKSTFCQRIIGNNNNNNNNNWIVLSQDTINNGKPGQRTKVEKEATRLLKEEKMSVIIDRMHLTPDQRKYFYDVAINCGVPAHVVLLNPSKSIVTQRVKSRTDHPGGVQGSQGIKLVLQSLNSLILPTYDEYIDDDNKNKNDDNNNNNNNNNNTTTVPQLISCTSTNNGAARLADLYRNVVHDTTTTASTTVTGNDDDDNYKKKQQQQQEHDIVLWEGNDKKFGNGMGNNGDDGNNITNGSNNKTKNDNTLMMPIITLGTMGIGKRITKDVLTMAYNIGCRSIDTAPTYKNEDRIGEVLRDLNNGNEKNNRMFCIVKVPKKVTKPDEVRTELMSSLQKLQLEGKGCDLLLLHWPCDVIGTGTLEDVWKEMESCMKDGLCRGLGVCNFNASALSQLLSCCTVRPVINQVERHPLLPQWDLIDYCSRHDIIVQAHTPLGHANDALSDHPTIKEVAKDTSLTPSQVVLQWNIQHGIPVVPKFSSKEHGRELFQLLENSNILSSMAMKKLNEIVLAPVEAGGGGKQGKNNNKTKRFVAPPFMYGKSPHCWGERPPPRETTKKSK